MQTKLSELYRNLAEGQQGVALLNACVHCGFCNATCPTYQIVGDEQDGPRGRIYRVRQLLEGATVTQETRLHFDRCLTCLNCETTCPSGVRYSRIIELGRHIANQAHRRSWRERVLRHAIRMVLTGGLPARLNPLIFALKALLPEYFSRRIPEIARPVQPRTCQASSLSGRTVILLAGCVQSGLRPDINQAAINVLNRLGIRAVEVAGAGCCGALHHHMDETEAARSFIRKNIDDWWPLIEQGAEALVMTASGCGVMLTDYGRLMQGEVEYAHKAALISAKTVDLAYYLQGTLAERLAERCPGLMSVAANQRIALHTPCTLQHGLRNSNTLTELLTRWGCTLTSQSDSHTCCGSAGSYALLQPEIAEQLRTQKIHNLQSDDPQIILTANIGCLMHMQTGTTLPVQHWIVWLANQLDALNPSAAVSDTVT